MCGIIGILGKSEVQDRLVDGLARLEYRGYDSAGLAVVDRATVSVVKAVGKLDSLQEKTLSNAAEVAARCARVVFVGANVSRAEDLALPEVPDIVLQFVQALAIQMISYFAALAKGTDVDRPKNLAKSVTVE